MSIKGNYSILMQREGETSTKTELLYCSFSTKQVLAFHKTREPFTYLKIRDKERGEKLE